MRDPLNPVTFQPTSRGNEVTGAKDGDWFQYDTTIASRKVTIYVASADPNDPIACSKPGVALARSLIL